MSDPDGEGIDPRVQLPGALSQSLVSRIWRVFALKPHTAGTRKLSGPAADRLI